MLGQAGRVDAVAGASVTGESAPWARPALPWRALAAVRIIGLCLVVVFAVSMVAAASAATAATVTVTAWGYNGNGELGNGTEPESNVPVAVSGLSEVTAIAAGGRHSLALLSNGTVMAWGANGHGQLGNGTRGHHSDVPVTVSELSEVTAVAAGGSHSLALLSNGTVMAWGANEFGQLGDGSEANSDVPVAVSLGLPPGVTVTAVSAGFAYSLALLSNGTVMAWGENEWGQLGNGTRRNDSDVPVAVSGLSEVTAIAAGLGHSLALLSNGTVMAWGSNEYGELGNGTGTESDVPVAVSGLSEVTAVAAGGTHSLALLKNGTVTAWGSNIFGELGDETFGGPETCSEGGFEGSCSDVPVAVSRLSEVTAIAAGRYHNLALLKNGTVTAWGSNDSGELGDETSSGPETCIFGPNSSACSDVPVAVSGLSEVTAIAAGRLFQPGPGLGGAVGPTADDHTAAAEQGVCGGWHEGDDQWHGVHWRHGGQVWLR